MGTLNEDLDTYADEFFNKGDVRAGIKLLSEIAGGVILAGALFTALTVWIPGLGIPVSGASAAIVMSQAVQAYGELDTEERKQIRAVVRWVKGGINFLD